MPPQKIIKVGVKSDLKKELSADLQRVFDRMTKGQDALLKTQQRWEQTLKRSTDSTRIFTRHLKEMQTALEGVRKSYSAMSEAGGRHQNLPRSGGPGGGGSRPGGSPQQDGALQNFAKGGLEGLTSFMMGRMLMRFGAAGLIGYGLKRTYDWAVEKPNLYRGAVTAGTEAQRLSGSNMNLYKTGALVGAKYNYSPQDAMKLLSSLAQTSPNHLLPGGNIDASLKFMREQGTSPEQTAQVAGMRRLTGVSFDSSAKFMEDGVAKGIDKSTRIQQIPRLMERGTAATGALTEKESSGMMRLMQAIEHSGGRGMTGEVGMKMFNSLTSPFQAGNGSTSTFAMLKNYMPQSLVRKAEQAAIAAGADTPYAKMVMMQNWMSKNSDEALRGNKKEPGLIQNFRGTGPFSTSMLLRILGVEESSWLGGARVLKNIKGGNFGGGRKAVIPPGAVDIERQNALAGIKEMGESRVASDALIDLQIKIDEKLISLLDYYEKQRENPQTITSAIREGFRDAVKSIQKERDDSRRMYETTGEIRMRDGSTYYPGGRK